MDINITITHSLSPTLESLVAKLAGAITADVGTAPVADAPKAPRAPRKAAVAESNGTTAPVQTTVAPTPPPAPSELTRADMSALVTTAMKKIGVDPMRSLFKTFGVSRLDDLPPAKYPELAAAINDAVSMA